jgi:RND superfamily putative drug exporter
MKNMGLEDMPRALPSMQTYDALLEHFPASGNSSIVIAEFPEGSSAAIEPALERLSSEIGARPELFSGAQPWISPDGRYALVTVGVPHRVDSAEARDSVRVLREEILPETLGAQATTAVGGAIAADLDYIDRQARVLPWLIALVIGGLFLFIFAAYRSLALACVTVVLNIASVLAAYGALVLVFQNTWAEGLLGFTSTGAIASWIPVLLFVALSGLSLDYHVFVLGRIKENADNGMETREAIFDGVVRTAGVVTSAAVVMVGVFAIFGSLSFLELKQIGVGLCVAVLLDATVIRILALPAASVLLRKVLWWPGIRGGAKPSAHAAPVLELEAARPAEPAGAGS